MNETEWTTKMTVKQLNRFCDAVILEFVMNCIAIPGDILDAHVNDEIDNIYDGEYLECHHQMIYDDIQSQVLERLKMRADKLRQTLDDR